jgi:hypothetical protein
VEGGQTRLWSGLQLRLSKREARALRRAGIKESTLYNLAATPSSIIDEAMTSDDVDFVEQSVLAAFDINDPVYVVGLQFYTTRKKISDITRELQKSLPGLLTGRRESVFDGALKFSGRRYFCHLVSCWKSNQKSVCLAICAIFLSFY